MSIINLLFAARRAISEWRLSEPAYGDLMALDDHLLADIGLDRLRTVARRGFAMRTLGVSRDGLPTPRLAPPIPPSEHEAKLARLGSAGARATLRRPGHIKWILLATAATVVAIPASAAQIGIAARHGISPTQPFSLPATTPLQQQIQQDYRASLLGAQRDLLQANPPGLGRQQIEIQHQLDTLPP